MLKNLGNALVLACSLLMSAAATADQAPGSAVGENLPPNVRSLLIQEMIAILEASKNIQDALIRGEDERVAEYAQAIHDSFIMQQKMTAEDKKALVSAVPKAFLQKDQAFHALSEKLAEAARDGDKPAQLQLFSRMLEACTQCHSQHAINRFPGFSDYQATNPTP